MWAVAQHVTCLTTIVAFTELWVGAFPRKVIGGAADVARFGFGLIRAFPRHVASLTAVKAASLSGLGTVLCKVAVFSTEVAVTIVSHCRCREVLKLRKRRSLQAEKNACKVEIQKQTKKKKKRKRRKGNFVKLIN